MNPDTLRWLDRWPGRLLCAVLGLFARRKPAQTGPLPAPRRMLIIKLTEMGSTVLALPALGELRAAWPDAEMYFLVFRNSRAILDALALAPPDRIVEIDDRTAARALISGGRALMRLRALRPEIAIDFDFFSHVTALFGFLVCRGARVGFDAFGAFRQRSHLLTHRVIYSPVQHTSRTFLALTRSVTHASAGEPFYRGPVDDRSFDLPVFAPTLRDNEEVRTLLRSKGIPDGAPLVLFSANASALLPLRRWPAGRFIEAARRLRARHPDFWIVLIGGAEERAEAAGMVLEMSDPQCVSVVGETSFTGFLTLCANARAMLCNDGGPAHFAGLARLPAVVLFGPETPALYAPLSPYAITVYRSLPCSPCVHVFNAKKSACPRALCLEAIPVEEAVQAVEDCLARDRHAPPC